MKKTKVIFVSLPSKSIFKIYYQKDKILLVNKNFDKKHKVICIHK